MEQAPLSPASEMEVDDRDEYDRMLEDEDEYPDGFWEGVDELEQQYCAIVSDHFRIFWSFLFLKYSETILWAQLGQDMTPV